MPSLSITEIQWVKLHLRLASLERSGTKLIYHFNWVNDTSLVCNVCFEDTEPSSLVAASPEDRLEIFQNWVDIGKSIMRYALQLAELPTSFVWNPTVLFVLDVSYGMGSSKVHEAQASFSWPDNSSSQG